MNYQNHFDYRKIRDYVVCIKTPDQSGYLGSGFFITDDLILTCAHVIKDLSPSVSFVQRDKIGTALILYQSERPSQGNELYPFPDLALLKITESYPHPSVRLENHIPITGKDLIVWGYPQTALHLPPGGSTATFISDGDEHEFLKFKLGEARPGLSGSPLMCSLREAVLGIVTASRMDDRGGYASPISALETLLVDKYFIQSTTTDPTITDPGTRTPLEFTEILSLNQDACLQQRAKWHSVFPIETKSALDEPWYTFEKTASSSPTELLIAESGVVPYLFHEEDLQESIDWCESSDPYAIAWRDGGGGTGKTRFAIELCKAMEKKGWVTGFIRWDTTLFSLPRPRLIIVDYAEAVDFDQLRLLLENLNNDLASNFSPVRILLLTRTIREATQTVMNDLLVKISPKLLRRIHSHKKNEMSLLDDEQKTHLFHVSTKKMMEAWHSRGVAATNDIPTPDLRSKQYALPLDVLFEALDFTILHAEGGEKGSGSAIERVFEHEQKYWMALAKRFWGQWNFAVPPLYVLEECVAIMTLAGAETEREAKRLFENHPYYRDLQSKKSQEMLMKWLSNLYTRNHTSEQFLTPLRPDRLGEHLVKKVAKSSELSFLEYIIEHASDNQLAHSFIVFSRILERQDYLAVHFVIEAFSRQYAELVDKSRNQALGSIGRPGRNTLVKSLVNFISEEKILQALRHIAPENTEYQRDLSISFNKLADLAQRSGDTEKARKLYEQSLQTTQILVEAEPENTQYQRDLSISFNKLADLAQRSGDTEKARKLYEQSLQTTQILVEAEPENTQYQRDLSISFDRLADLAQRSGDTEKARKLYEQSLQTTQILVEAEPENTEYQRDLSISFDRLADLAQRSGDTEKARKLYEQSLDIRKTLVEAEPSNIEYQRDLSISFDQLADLAQRSGDTEKARKLYEQSLDIRQILVEAEPSNIEYQRDLSFSFDQLADLAQRSGDTEKARKLYEQSLDIRQILVEAEPENTECQRDLSISFNQLADLAQRSGDTEKARKLYEQSLDIRKTLVEAEPSNIEYQQALVFMQEKLAHFKLTE